MGKEGYMADLLRKVGPNAYDFNYLKFKGETDEWKLIGTFCDIGKESGDSVDEYKSNSGKYMEVVRSKMFREQLKGKIIPIDTCPVIGPSEYNSRVKKRLF
ncbi:MAG: hypothetical protein EOO20_04760 [Chryseobacterium sp.]|nr:MAG: hypothetical protein EOO20_04760 [Chryseobacterium sp.]